jgi:antitoxin VapB
MAKARVVEKGKYQVVLFPKTIRLRSKEVEIFRRGDDIILLEKPTRIKRKRQKP